jgi:signal transduction histidine kinase
MAMNSGPRSDRSSKILNDLAQDLRSVNERLLITSVREQESAEVATREKVQLAALIEALHEGVVMVDVAGRVLLINVVARGLLELTSAPEAADSIHVRDFREKDGQPLSADKRPLARALRGESFVDEELLLFQAAGAKRRVMASGTSVRSGNEIAFAILVLRDVTERRALERRLAQSEKLAALGTLSAGMAHEINNPLAYALGNVDFVLDALPDAQQRLRALGGGEADAVAARLGELADALREGKEGAVRVHHIVEDLKRFGRAEAAQEATLELCEVLDCALRMTASHLRHHATVRRDYRPTPRVRANEGQLGQVFTNLLMNAAHAVSGATGAASPESNEVVVAMFTDDAGRAVVEIRDSGPGIADDLKGRIFDPFFTTKPVGSGTGLGLSICFSIVESLGGALTVASEPGEGATFRVILPALAVEPTSVPVVSASLPLRRGRVLVIDDEPAIRRLIGRLLKQDHEVIELGNAREALALIATDEPFDMILCDLMMPGLTGAEFYEALRELQPQSLDNVVFLTGGAFTERSQKFLDSIANATMMKPLQPEQLRSLVAEHVNRSRSQR